MSHWTQPEAWVLSVPQHHKPSHESVSCISFIGCYFCWFSIDSTFNSCICCQNEKRRGSHSQIHRSPHIHRSHQNQSSLCSHTGSQSFCSCMGTGPGSTHIGSQIGSHSGPQIHRGLHSGMVSSTHHRRGPCRKSSFVDAGTPEKHTPRSQVRFWAAESRRKSSKLGWSWGESTRSLLQIFFILLTVPLI